MTGFYMIDCTNVILSEIDDGLDQGGVALSYALAIKSEEAEMDNPNWMKINRAIIDKWSITALKRIKNAAWKIVNGG
jgi:hypothetical protein